MTPDDIFAKKITTYLDHGDRRSQGRHRLSAAARPGRGARAPCRPAACAGNAPGGRAGGQPAPERRAAAAVCRVGGWLWIGIALIVAAGFGYQQWQAYQQLNDIEETDAAILSSELPIDAYLDRGFQNWLKRASDDE